MEPLDHPCAWLWKPGVLPVSILAKIVLCIALLVTGFGGGVKFMKGVQAQKDLATEQETRRIENRRQSMAAGIQESKDAKNRAVIARQLALIDELRNRPERAVNPTTCTGATGAELSRPDAGFLAGEAARADRQRNALEACYAQYDSLK